MSTKLEPGTYRALMVAKDAAGNRSAQAVARFVLRAR
jgi:hypothetical protein